MARASFARATWACVAWALVLLLGLLDGASARRAFNLSRSLPMASTNFNPYEVFVTRTATKPSFWQPIYKKKGGDWEEFAKEIVTKGYFEKEETSAFLEAIGHACHVDHDNLVLDVGGFNGYYSMLAASVGCKVQVWEAQPQNVQMVQLAVLLNRAWSRVKVHHRICSNGTQPLHFSGTAMDGHVSGSYQHSDNANRLAEMKAYGWKDDPNAGAMVYPLSLDNAIPEGKQVTLLKVDVEGHEPFVLNGATRLLRTRSITKILMEYNMWRSMTVDEGVAMVSKLLDFGYNVYIQPTPKCTRKPLTSVEQIREISVQLRDNTYPCASWAIYLLCTTTPLTHL